MPYERLVERNLQPTDEDMVKVIGPTLSDAWTRLRHFLVETYHIEPFLQFGGPRYGWNIQHRKGGRPLAEIYPECGSFCVLVILGQKELAAAMTMLETFGQVVQRALIDTPRYHDGTWMYMRIQDPLTCQQDVDDIEQLILIKKNPPRKKIATV